LKYGEAMRKHSIFKLSVITAQANKYIKVIENKSPQNLCMDEATLQKHSTQQHNRKRTHSLTLQKSI